MKRAFALACLVLIVACSRSSNPAGDRAVVRTKGSDSLLVVAQLWAEAYKKVDKEAAVTVSGGGSGTGFAALINGTTEIANTSREISRAESDALTRQGFAPYQFVVGYDALAVVVHPDNPLPSLSSDQLAAIYGEGGEIDTWSQLGITVPGCESDEIVRVARQTSSGTHVYLRRHELGENGEFKLGSRDVHGTKDVITLVKNTPCAIGYSGLAYVTKEVRALPLSRGDGAPVEPSIGSALDGSYPIARPLFMYTRERPDGAVRRYIDWILSRDGQCLLYGEGYAPVFEITCD